MPPKKRRGPDNSEHHGRVTVRRESAPSLPSAADPSLTERRSPAARRTHVPAASSRYTPPIKSIRLRPDWHRNLGIGLLVLGIAIVVLNDAMLLGANATLLPGGHTELYLVLGLVVTLYSTRWFGWFDREQ